MNTAVVSLPFRRVRCHWRALILAGAAIALLTWFWVASRYPQLFSKAEHLGQVLPSMAYSKEMFTVDANTPLWKQILAVTGNWLNSMRVGMTFGILFGALLHTVLRYYPLRVGNNVYLNSIKGALVGMPMGVCANCAVPAACGVTRGHGKVEVALGFLFSSPNFNPVVVTMTFLALPLAMTLTKYAILLFVIIVLVPALIQRLERAKPLPVLTMAEEGICAVRLPAQDNCDESFADVGRELAVDFGRNVWMLFKPTITIMLFASVIAAAMLILVPWDQLFSEATPAKLAIASVISVLMPVPIALDVMFAANLLKQGIDPGYVMMFAMTLGTFSIIPCIYLWRDVSRPLAIWLLASFMLIGLVLGLIF